MDWVEHQGSADGAQKDSSPWSWVQRDLGAAGLRSKGQRRQEGERGAMTPKLGQATIASGVFDFPQNLYQPPHKCVI